MQFRSRMAPKALAVVSVAVTLITAGGLGVLAHQTKQARHNPASSLDDQARGMFGEARDLTASLPPEFHPEYLAYLGHQELEEGEREAGGSDLDAAFRAAVALPVSPFGHAAKREVEPGVIAALVESGNWEAANGLAASADGGKAEIADELLPALLAAGQSGLAWSTWPHLLDGAAFPFHAAAAMLGAGGSAADQHDLMRAAAAAMGRVSDTMEAGSAADFLEVASRRGAAPASLEAAARQLDDRVNAIRAAGWERTAIHQRLAALVARPDPAKPLDPPALAALAPRVPSQPADPLRSPAAGLFPFSADQEDHLIDQIGVALLPASGDLASRVAQVPNALMAAAPMIAALWARDFYEGGHVEGARALLQRALTAVDAKLVTEPAPGEVNFDGPYLRVYGMAAQMDFPEAVRHARALPPGWFKPLALAHVARMAPASATYRPGRMLQLLH